MTVSAAYEQIKKIFKDADNPFKTELVARDVNGNIFDISLIHTAEQQGDCEIGIVDLLKKQLDK